jgi:3-oxoacyl-(acyl-carrier-protein) synthase
MRDAPRAVVTGLGVVTALGETPDEFFASLVAGRSGIVRRRSVRPDEYSELLGDLEGFDLDAHLGRVGCAYPSALLEQMRRTLRAATFSSRVTAAAAVQAAVGAGLLDSGIPPERIAHVLGGHNISARFSYDNTLTFQGEPDYIDPLHGFLALDTDIVAVVSEVLGIEGPSFLVGNACASSNTAVLAAVDLLRVGRADAVVVTGALCDVDPVTLHGWALLSAISCRSFNDDPARASRPFDGRREGFVPAHAAAAVVLERPRAARARGAVVRGELLGGGATCDASRVPTPRLRGQVRAIRTALEDAGVAPQEVGYVNAHAASTPLGDAVEVESLKTVFGDHAAALAVNSTKSMTGHCLGAAGMVELVATVLQLERGVLHPTINQEVPDPALGLDFVPNAAREQDVEVAISNSFGFGGLSTCLVLGRAS